MDGFWHVQGPGTGISAEPQRRHGSEFSPPLWISVIFIAVVRSHG